MGLKAGVARTRITPFWGVELTGWGYFLNRTWEWVQDDLQATALVLERGETTLAVVSLDLMVISDAFTRQVRETVEAETGIPPANVMVACTHTHNAPASGGLLGVGEVDPFYEQWAARQAASAIILAWRNRESADLSAAGTNLPKLTFNRTRENGPVDPRLTTLRVNRTNGSPLAMVVNFQAHPTVQTKLRPRAVSRDVPGDICDLSRTRPAGGDGDLSARLLRGCEFPPAIFHHAGTFPRAGPDRGGGGISLSGGRGAAG